MGRNSDWQKSYTRVVDYESQREVWEEAVRPVRDSIDGAEEVGSERGHKQVSLALAATDLLGLAALVGALFTGVPDLSGVAHLPQAAWASLGAPGQWALGVVTSLGAAGGIFFYRGGLDVQGEGGRAQGPEDQSSLLGRWGSRLVWLLLGIVTAPARPAIGVWNWANTVRKRGIINSLDDWGLWPGGSSYGPRHKAPEGSLQRRYAKQRQLGRWVSQGRQLA